MINLIYTKNDVIKALTEAGLEKGDTAYFSTSLGMLGIAEGVKDLNDLSVFFLNAIKEVMGPEGTIIVPTYSYTIGGSTKENPKIFDPLTTPSKIGPFPEFFRQQEGTIRSMDPMMSMAGLGPKANNIFHNIPKTSYGKDSVYERLLYQPHSKCVSIGLGPNWTPFIHYADWLNQVPHRYDKMFYGGIKHPDGKIEYTYWLYSVPARIEESVGQAHILGKEATRAGIWKYAPLGRARVYVCDYKKYFDFAMELMKENKWLMTNGKSCDVIKFDQKKLKSKINFFPEKEKKVGKELS